MTHIPVRRKSKPFGIVLGTLFATIYICFINLHKVQLLVGHLNASAISDVPPLPDITLQSDDITGIQEATRLLYKRSNQLDYWTHQPPPKVYIYKTLPQEMSVASVSKCIDERYNSRTSKQQATCGWFPKVCDEQSSSSNQHYNVYRDNFNSDVVLIHRFSTYQHVTQDPNKANFFVVPYPHRSHCFCKNDNTKKIYSCSYSFSYIQENVLKSLPYYNVTSKQRHLFMLGSDFALSNPPFRREVPFHVSTGPADGCRPNRHSNGKNWSESCGSITIPFVNTDRDYQPESVIKRSDDWWMTRSRTYAMAVIMGTPPQLGVRRDLMKRQNELFGSEIGGLPIMIQDIGTRQRFLTQHQQVMQMYQDAIFCPILAGDDCGQKRLFDVILSGCIPVVLSYQDSDEPTWASWFKPGLCSIRRSFPYSRGTFYGDGVAGIDYTEFVVQVNGTCGLECIKSTLEEIMNKPNELQRMRMGLKQYAHLFSYGLGESSGTSVDAFSALLVSIRHYLSSL